MRSRFSLLFLLVTFVFYAQNTTSVVYDTQSGSGPGANTRIGLGTGNASTGDQNTFVGYESGRYNVAGIGNTSLGFQSGKSNSSGSNNLFLGWQAGFYALGSNNIFIGSLAGGHSSMANSSNNIMIGNGAGAYLSGDKNIFIGAAVRSGPETEQVTGNNTTNTFIVGDQNSAKYKLIIDDNGFAGIGLNGNFARPQAMLDVGGAPRFRNLATTTENTFFLTVDADGDVSQQLFGGTAANAWSLTGNANTNPSSAYDVSTISNTNFIGTTDEKDLIFRRKNLRAGGISPTNISLGVNSLNPSVAGTNNVAIGTNALAVNVLGLSNVAMGGNSLVKNTSGKFNTAIGVGTLGLNLSGEHNVALGYQAGAGSKKTANTYVGCQSGYENNGIANVFIGFNSGYREGGSNKLYIQNSKTLKPLIYGDFASKDLIFNIDSLASSRVTVRAFTSTDGTSGLKFSNLTSSFIPAENSTKFLTVNNDGDVVLKNVAENAIDKSIYTHDGHLVNTTTTGGLRTVYLDNSNLVFSTQQTTDSIKGKIYIGSNPSFPIIKGNYRLYVEGGILTEKAKVALRNAAHWADYVFANDYKLMPLTEVESFVKENKRLPGIESAEELVKSGLDLGDMQAKQMGKIEELTLYAIEQQKTLEKQNKEIEELKAMVKLLMDKK